MENFRNLIKDFMEDEEGLTLLEYILGAALIVSAFVVAGNSFWDELKLKFDNVSSTISNS
ncbi:fimbrial protein [Vibrio harveyi]|jgi:pilus assembly protein Flp/PilA|nr:hypothetical protein [Vibrio harveyi]APP05507.1 hypothetical protein BG259_09135 [Vibrio harveyi]ELH7811261.1 hypothetical protein [Vibrio harveyi]KNY46882.1 fimbrial protein [Vibrio harveyi]MDF6014219.1 hypothetical protein [Vibrio harveyi]